MTTNNWQTDLTDLYTEQVKDLYDAEQQLASALSKMANAATSQDLRQAFMKHLDQTREHINRLDEVRSRRGISGTKKCEAMAGLIQEGQHAIQMQGNSMVRDAALISAAQRAEHYEISAYGTLRAFADHLNFDQDKALFDKTIQEEGDTDKKLTKLAEGGFMSEGINEKAMSSR